MARVLGPDGFAVDVAEVMDDAPRGGLTPGLSRKRMGWPHAALMWRMRLAHAISGKSSLSKITCPGVPTYICTGSELKDNRVLDEVSDGEPVKSSKQPLLCFLTT